VHSSDQEIEQVINQQADEQRDEKRPADWPAKAYPQDDERQSRIEQEGNNADGCELLRCRTGCKAYNEVVRSLDVHAEVATTIRSIAFLLGTRVTPEEC